MEQIRINKYINIKVELLNTKKRKICFDQNLMARSEKILIMPLDDILYNT